MSEWNTALFGILAAFTLLLAVLLILALIPAAMLPQVIYFEPA